MSDSADNRHEAKLYEPLPDGRVRCRLCAHRCVIADGATGFCNVRVNDGGTLYTRVYGRTISQSIDPIEKKPLYHFLPGSRSYSIATPGCNFRCAWCQNWQISQEPGERHFRLAQPATPGELVDHAKRGACATIAYTYTEPTIYYEYARDIAELAVEAGIRNVFVSNGYMTRAMLDDMGGLLHAANIDLKAMRDETYQRYASARLQPVLQSLHRLHAMGVWLEVTTLVIPTINDDPGELREMARFIHDELGAGTPWHLSAFHPCYRLNDVEPTPLSVLQQAGDIAQQAGLQHVYMGNVIGDSSTYCPDCKTPVIRRAGMNGAQVLLDDRGQCPQCAQQIGGVFA